MKKINDNEETIWSKHFENAFNKYLLVAAEVIVGLVQVEEVALK